MISKLLLILILIDIANCDKYIKKNRALNAALKDTSDFFGRLKLDYGIKFRTIKISKSQCCLYTTYRNFVFSVERFERRYTDRH